MPAIRKVSLDALGQHPMVDGELRQDRFHPPFRQERAQEVLGFHALVSVAPRQLPCGRENTQGVDSETPHPCNPTHLPRPRVTKCLAAEESRPT